MRNTMYKCSMQKKKQETMESEYSKAELLFNSIIDYLIDILGEELVSEVSWAEDAGVEDSYTFDLPGKEGELWNNVSFIDNGSDAYVELGYDDGTELCYPKVFEEAKEWIDKIINRHSENNG